MATDMASDGPAKRKLWIPLTGLMTAVALSALDGFIVNPALPRIVGEFGGLAHLSWVMTGFLLASTITMPLYGKFSDLYGRRPLFTLSIAIFLLGSALCGGAQSMTQLILFRAVQGIGAGGAVVLSMTCMGDLVSPRERPRYQGLFNAVFTVCSIAGPVVGGLVTSALGWRWVFYINLPVGLIALAMIWSTLPGHVGEKKSHKIDYAGVLLLIVGSVSFLLLLQKAERLEQLMTLQALLLAVLAVGAFGLLLPQERRASEPILAVHLLRNKVFANTLVASAAIGLGFFGSSVFLPLYFQMVGGHTPAESGLLLLPQLLSGTAMSLLGGQYVSRTGKYKGFILTGMTLVSAAFFGFALVAHFGLGDEAAIACLMMMGAGGGMCMPNMTVALQNSIEPRDLGVGTSTMQFCNQLAAVAGVAISGLLLAQRARSYALGKLPEDIVDQLLRDGIRLVERLSGADKLAVVDIYRHAFTMNFLTSGLVSATAIYFATRIPVLALRGGSKDEAAKSIPGH